MRRLFQATLLGGLLCAFGIGIYGCGSSNNDQGMSFTLVSYNAVDSSGKCDPDTLLTGMEIPINSGSGSESSSSLTAVFSCMTLQNNLSGQGLRVERVLHDFYIEGASVQPPSALDRRFLG